MKSVSWRWALETINKHLNHPLLPFLAVQRRSHRDKYKMPLNGRYRVSSDKLYFNCLGYHIVSLRTVVDTATTSIIQFYKSVRIKPKQKYTD